MTRKLWILIGLAVLLGGFSLYINQDWFAKDTIQIYHLRVPRVRVSFDAVSSRLPRPLIQSSFHSTASLSSNCSK